MSAILLLLEQSESILMANVSSNDSYLEAIADGVYVFHRLVANVADCLGRCLLARGLHLDFNDALERMRLPISSESHGLVLEQLPLSQR